MDIQHQILEKIREYDRILLFRHARIDGDCVGSTKGMQALLRATFPEKEVWIIDDEKSEHLAFMGEADPHIPDEQYADALGIVIDTATQQRIANQRYKLCRELIKIDHHINIQPYGDLMWVEEERSSACEMIAAFYEACSDEVVITREAAEAIYTGMVTDSGRFRYEGVNGGTLRLAALMLDQGIDTDKLYANLYTASFESLKFKAYVYQNMQRTENGVAYIRITQKTREEFGISVEDASAGISYLEGIRGCLCWLIFVDMPDGSIRVRLRSRFMAINTVAEHYRGGGHACASGSTVYNDEEIAALIHEADEAVRAYKKENKGWM